jgi:hemerythrin
LTTRRIFDRIRYHYFYTSGSFYLKTGDRMPVMIWTSELSVGITEIDEQHRNLITLLNQLSDAVLAGNNTEGIQKTLTGLIDYTQSHFSTEENLFKKYDYPETIAHTEEHNKFKQKVIEFERDFKMGKMVLFINISKFIKDWLTNHIKGTDKKYGPFLNEKGIK